MMDSSIGAWRGQMDIVLVSAIEPFGFGHVLPRGAVCVNPFRGLRRANAVVITHADEAAESELSAITQQVRQIHPTVANPSRGASGPADCEAACSAAVAPGSCGWTNSRADAFVGFCGIGNPQSFDRQLKSLGGHCVGCRHFADHHAYTPADLDALRAKASAAGADLLLTTEKDWVKVCSTSQCQLRRPTRSARIECRASISRRWRREIARTGGEDGCGNEVFMKRRLLMVAIILGASVGGCHKKRTLGNFGLKPGLTIQEVEDQMGAPTKESPAWLAYAMEDGSELRLYFLEGKRGTERTLSEADIYTRARSGSMPYHASLQVAADHATHDRTRDISDDPAIERNCPLPNGHPTALQGSAVVGGSISVRYLVNFDPTIARMTATIRMMTTSHLPFRLVFWVAGRSCSGI